MKFEEYRLTTERHIRTYPIRELLVRYKKYIRPKISFKKKEKLMLDLDVKKSFKKFSGKDNHGREDYYGMKRGELPRINYNDFINEDNEVVHNISDIFSYNINFLYTTLNKTVISTFFEDMRPFIKRYETPPILIDVCGAITYDEFKNFLKKFKKFESVDEVISGISISFQEIFLLYSFNFKINRSGYRKGSILELTPYFNLIENKIIKQYLIERKLLNGEKVKGDKLIDSFIYNDFYISSLYSIKTFNHYLKNFLDIDIRFKKNDKFILESLFKINNTSAYNKKMKMVVDLFRCIYNLERINKKNKYKYIKLFSFIMNKHILLYNIFNVFNKHLDKNDDDELFSIIVDSMLGTSKLKNPESKMMMYVISAITNNGVFIKGDKIRINNTMLSLSVKSKEKVVRGYYKYEQLSKNEREIIYKRRNSQMTH